MTAYYNEIEPFAAQWLRNLIAQNLIAPGDVDTRSIVDVHPDDLRGYTQCHFFAEIGGWSYALRLAGWADDRPVWTGSCPCQPFSTAGKQRGSEDERHLWPAFFRLIRECRPATVFGEQVAGAAGYAWFDHVAADLEGEGYAAAACDIGAHSVGAPHRRQRLYWVAHADEQRKPACHWRRLLEGSGSEERGRVHGLNERGSVGILGNTDNTGLEGRRDESGEHAGQFPVGSASIGVLGDAECSGRKDAIQQFGDGAEARLDGQANRHRSSGAYDPWRDLEWLPCSDGKARPTQPGLSPLAHGVSGRVGRLRAYGNAIVPQVAAEFIKAAA